MDRVYYTYILAGISKRLYTGVTNNLKRRMFDHKRGEGSVFAAKYKINRLVFYESFQYVTNAIAREKEIKDMLRSKKVALIEQDNPEWLDLAENWFTAEQLIGE